MKTEGRTYRDLNDFKGAKEEEASGVAEDTREGREKAGDVRDCEWVGEGNFMNESGPWSHYSLDKDWKKPLNFVAHECLNKDIR